MFDLITIFCLAYIITTTDFPFVLAIKKWAGLGEDRTLISRFKFLDWIFKNIHKILNCPICLSFWLMLILTLNIKYAIITYVVMVLFDNIVEFFKSNIKY